MDQVASGTVNLTVISFSSIPSAFVQRSKTIGNIILFAIRISPPFQLTDRPHPHFDVTHISLMHYSIVLGTICGDQERVASHNRQEEIAVVIIVEAVQPAIEPFPRVVDLNRIVGRCVEIGPRRPGWVRW